MAQERVHVQQAPVAQPQVPAPPPPQHQNRQDEQAETAAAGAIAEVFVAPPPSLDSPTFVDSYNTEPGE